MKKVHTYNKFSFFLLYSSQIISESVSRLLTFLGMVSKSVLHSCWILDLFAGTEVIYTKNHILITMTFQNFTLKFDSGIETQRVNVIFLPLRALNNLQGKEACRESVVSHTLKVLTAPGNYRLSGFTDA